MPRWGQIGRNPKVFGHLPRRAATRIVDPVRSGRDRNRWSSWSSGIRVSTCKSASLDPTTLCRCRVVSGSGNGPRRRAVPGDQTESWWWRMSLREPLLLLGMTTALTAGGVAWLTGSPAIADLCWLAGTVLALLPALWWVLAGLRHRQFGVDIIAVLSLLGTLVVGEYLAGVLIGVMLATGRVLDAAASRRAARDLHALLDRAPRTARRRRGETIEVVPLDDVISGDVLAVGPGEIVPVDGRLASKVAELDESALTGESLPVSMLAGQALRSGTVNAGSAFEIEAQRTAADSTFAGIVRLAGEAAAEKAPFVRLADRLAAWFVPLTLVVASTAWAVTGSLTRGVAVLVVATPCPLLLAVPVAIVSGLSRSSRIGVVFRDGAALENLGYATTLVLDKTGTLTAGRPSGLSVTAAPGVSPTTVLRLAASAEQVSPHVLAEAIVREALRRSLTLSVPENVNEQAGTGVVALVDEHRVSVGSLSALPPDAGPWAEAVLQRSELDASVIVWVTIDDLLAGAITLVDEVRRDAPRTLRRLRAVGLDRIIMVTGDRARPAQEIGTLLGLDCVYAEQTPADKVFHVRSEKERAVTVMVGDGVNDAPALAAATIGVAMGARGSTATSEVADIVLTTDRIDRLADAVEIARRSRRIAVQSAVAGMGMSLAAMIFAASGLLPPAAGALLQEAIDVAVILNALRALRGGRESRPLARSTGAMLRMFAREHDEMRGQLSSLAMTAQLVAANQPERAFTSLREVDTFLVTRVLPHERGEEHVLYPALAAPLGSSEATATMSRMHAEIDRLGRRIHAHLVRAEVHGGITTDQREDLVASLYGLYELLRLHFLQEEESYFSLAPSDDQRHSTTDSSRARR